MLTNCHFPASLVTTELYCKLPFPSGPVRNPGLRPALGPLHAQGQLWSTPGGGCSLYRCFLPSCSQLFPSIFLFAEVLSARRRNSGA